MSYNFQEALLEIGSNKAIAVLYEKETKYKVHIITDFTEQGPLKLVLHI